MDNLLTILYVKNQEDSKQFYETLFGLKPTLHVPGMTEFNLFGNCAIGLMPEESISKVITPATTHPKKGSMIPRCELYFRVNNADKYFKTAIKLGAKNVSNIAERNWGEKVGYIADFDGHILAFAEK